MARAQRTKRRTAAEEQVRHLIAVDAMNVMRRLTARLEEMVALFSRLRSRAPMLETLHSTFGTASFADLAMLTITEQTAVNAFYESLSELRWYASYTEDMPQLVRSTVAQHLRKLQFAYARLIEVMGAPGADAGPVVDVDFVEAPTAALATAAKRTRR